jgi:hypothetical protein
MPEVNGLPIVSGRRRRWIQWADLLRRVFLFDVLACARGGRRKVIAAIRDERVARKILEHLCLPAEAPRPLPARDDQLQGHLWPTGPPPDGLAQFAPPDEPFGAPETDFDQREPSFDIGA